MDRSAHRRSGWVALAVTCLARMLLAVLASLLLWALAPAALGLHPTVVMTGSMLPRLVPGDVVMSRPVPAERLQLGQTLLFPDPDHAGHLRLHRWVAVTGDGRLVTRGDANPADDSTPVDRSTVVGVASLRVPFVARPVVWANEGDTTAVALAALGLLVVVAAACWFRPADDDAPPAPADDDASGAAPGTDEVTDASPGGPRRQARAGAVLVAAAALLGTSATGADAATVTFTRAAATPAASWGAATYFSCAGAARGAGARFAWPLSETSGPTAQDVTANGLDGTYAGGVTYRVAGPCASDATTGVTLNGTSGVVSTTSTATDIPELTLQLWFKSATTGRGGTLMSLTTTTGFILTTDTTSMALGMTTTGTLSFGVAAGGTKRLTSPAAYRDNAWHQVTGVVGAGGMVLYVDGAAVASNPAVTSASAVTGTPRVGYGDASDLGTSTYDYYAGSVAFASLFKDSLTAAQVLASYRAAS